MEAGKGWGWLVKAEGIVCAKELRKGIEKRNCTGSNNWWEIQHGLLQAYKEMRSKETLHFLEFPCHFFFFFFLILWHLFMIFT